MNIDFPKDEWSFSMGSPSQIPIYYFLMAHAPTEIPSWFEPDMSEHGPPPPPLLDPPRIGIIRGGEEKQKEKEWLEEYANHQRWDELRKKERYFQWRIYYANELIHRTNNSPKEEKGK